MNGNANIGPGRRENKTFSRSEYREYWTEAFVRADNALGSILNFVLDYYAFGLD